MVELLDINLKKYKRILVDIDNTICITNGMDYSNSIPNFNRIKFLNNLYEMGIEIIYWTGRGSGTGIDWRIITEQQLKQWGVKYKEILFGKPIYDLFIDDKSMNSDYFFQRYKIS